MKTLSPRKATTDGKIMKLKTDSSPSGSEEWSLLVHSNYVSLHSPASTELGFFCIPRREFNKIVDWYNKEQKINP